MIELARDLLRDLARVRSVGVITGAGVSAESGIPTYRGKGGIYDDPAEGDRVMESLSGACLVSDPDRTWRTIAQLAVYAKKAEPNAAHHALVRIEQRCERLNAAFTLLTQNVDGLHQRAGSRNVIDIHGDRLATLCTGCGDAGRIHDPERIQQTPRCARCESRLRPGVVLFGEMLPEPKLARLHQAFFEQAPDLVIIAGTSAMFPYILMPVLAAAQSGRLTIEINLEDGDLTPVVGHSLRGKAGDLLPAIARALDEAV